MRKSTYNLTLSAFFIALGILIPILFHAVGLGSMFLPMFLPVAASIFFLPLYFSVCVAVVTPVVSSLLFGMPPISPPIMQIIVAELFALVCVTFWLYNRKSMNIFLSLGIGVLISRIVLIIWILILVPLFGIPAKAFTIITVVQGIPGVILLITVVPFFVKRLNIKIRESK